MSTISAKELDPILGPSIKAWEKLFGYIRVNYSMDEFWDGKNEVKFRKSNKTFVTFYVHESYFTLLLIYGKKERAVLEEQINKFPEYLQDYYRNSKTYHDGKWMFIDIHDETYIDSLIKMMYIKKKPNRKKENLANVILGKCGNRCDQCQLYRM